jgi:hypothetical protein
MHKWGNVPDTSHTGQGDDLEILHKRLRVWLGCMFATEFRDLGAILIGQQDNGHSCGICAINAMEHAIFSTPLFTNEG